MKLRQSWCAVMLLFPALLLAQAASSSPKTQASPATRGGDTPVMSTAAKTRAKQIFGYFNSGQTAALYAAFGPQMRKNTSPAKLSAMAKQLAVEWGREQKLLGENFAPDLLTAGTVYSRFSQFSKAKDPILTMATVDEHGQVSLLQFRPAPPPSENRFADYKSATQLRLPFDGSWFVHQGGRDIYQNGNAYGDTERYSMVFTVLKDGRPFSGDGTKNEQFFCYGQPVRAPADGTVVLIKDTFADNPPGSSQEILPGGNRVLIHHTHQEYSLLLHLKQNSVKVKAGDKVKQGDIIGECGNSGNSPAPNLEYRLQNSKGAPLPWTLPVQFVDYVADGTPLASGEPVRGQTLQNSATAAPPLPAEVQTTDNE